MHKIPERVHEGPVFDADVEGKEVPRAIVPWPTSSGHGGLPGIISPKEVPRAYLPRGCFSQD